MGIFFDFINANETLKYVDEHSEKEYSIHDLDLVELEETNKELVFAYLDNSIQAIRWFWSIMKSEHVLVLLSENLDEKLKSTLEVNYSPKYIIDYKRDTVLNYVQSDQMGCFVKKMHNSVVINENIKLLLSTSGTTGSPKFVKLSETNILTNALDISQYLNIQNTDVVPLNLPIYYSYGLSVLTSNAVIGNKVVCSNTDILNRLFWENLDRFKYSSLAGVPMVYEMLDRIGFRKKIYPSLRYITQAGGKLSNELILKFADYSLENKLNFFVMYGATEATARMSYLDPSQIKNKLGSIGKPLKSGTFSINQENGELQYCGPNVFGGYVESPQDLDSFDQSNCLNTGDIAQVDQDGFYFITGRIKRIVKLFGLRINLDEIEHYLSNELHSSIKCIGIDDKKIGVFYCDKDLNNSKINEILIGIFKLHISTIVINIIDKFPVTLNGKTDYKELSKIIK